MKKILLVFSLIFLAILFTNSVLGAEPLIQISFSTNPITVAPGSDGYVQMILTNIGTAGAYSIDVNGISYDDQYITVATSGIGNLGSLGNGQSTTALFKVFASNTAPSGLYTIVFSMDYCSSGSLCTTITPTAIIRVQAPSALQITSVEPSTLAAGETTNLNFNLKNNGADAISNIVLSWQTPDNEMLPLGLSNTQFISSLSGGASINIPVNVSVGSSVTPGVYPITIKIEYFDRSGTKQNFTSSVGIKIGGTTDFDVGVQESSAGTTSLSIANIGVNPATSVSVTIPNQQEFAVSGTTSVFIGTLNAGDFGIASFQISSRTSITNLNRTIAETPLTVEISYSDTSGTRQTVQKEVSLNLATTQTFGNAQRNQGSELTIILIVVILIIAVALLWHFKFRKKKK